MTKDPAMNAYRNHLMIDGISGFGIHHPLRVIGACVVLVTMAHLLADPATANEPNRLAPPAAGSAAPFAPAVQPTMTGEFLVGIVTIQFRDTEFPGDQEFAMRTLDTVIATDSDKDPAAKSRHTKEFSPVSMEEYFKTYSNGITWPRVVMMNDLGNAYSDRNLFGHYCANHHWRNPIGWATREEGEQRLQRLHRAALDHANRSYRGTRPHLIYYNYITTRSARPSREITLELRGIYRTRNVSSQRERRDIQRAVKRGEHHDPDFDPWEAYSPVCNWGDPAWQGTMSQIHDFSGGMLAHEIGHALGAPNINRVGSRHDGIGGDAVLLPYGPTATAFSRFYHHGFVSQLNHPTINFSGTYTLHPRHIHPKGDEAVGYLISSNHPHYMYHVEYVHGENPTVGVGPAHEGMLVSVVNLGSRNFLGPPDLFYVYRPNDPHFLGRGNLDSCLFGRNHSRTEFNLNTNPSSRLPNSLDGGVSLKNISENGDTLTFDVEIDRKIVVDEQYRESLLPKMRLGEITDIQQTGFAMSCITEFRGEPLKTMYGFCWSTSPKPTVRDQMLALSNREIHRGRALNLAPGTTYYVRAFATNGAGVRYSDEERTVRTLDPGTAPQSIGPLLNDGFSGNWYLASQYSHRDESTNILYSPTCVMAKLIGYYRPPRFSYAMDARATYVDFNRMHWRPSREEYPPRLVEVNRFFNVIYEKGRRSGLHLPRPDQNFARKIATLAGLRSIPVLQSLDRQDVPGAEGLIRNDLLQSRPVILLFENSRPGSKQPMRWTLIDGVDAEGRFHIHVPIGNKLSMRNQPDEMGTGYYKMDELLRTSYHLHVVTSLSY